MNIFSLAKAELAREGKDIDNMALVLDRAISIRRWIDKHGKNTVQKILAGAQVYQYGNIVKTYNPAYADKI